MSQMDDIQLFIKKNATSKLKMSIKYEDTHNSYNYNYNGINLIFKEYYTDENDNYIHLVYNKKTYENFNDIQLILFELFNYKTIEYIDIYMQRKIEKTSLHINDFYNDYYDDINDKLICSRRLTLDDLDVIKFKFVIVDKTEITLYYKTETIKGFDEIIKKIDELLKDYQK
jgi:hypothetical protein